MEVGPVDVIGIGTSTLVAAVIYYRMESRQRIYRLTGSWGLLIGAFLFAGGETLWGMAFSAAGAGIGYLGERHRRAWLASQREGPSGKGSGG